MKIIYLPLTLTVVGLLLIVWSLLWPGMVSTESVWSDQSAREYSQAAAEVHHLQSQAAHQDDPGGGHGHSHATAHGPAGNPPDVDGTPEEVRRRHERLKAELEAARRFRDRTAKWLKWTGIVTAIFGVVGYGVLRAGADS